MKRERNIWNPINSLNRMEERKTWIGSEVLLLNANQFGSLRRHHCHSCCCRCFRPEKSYAFEWKRRRIDFLIRLLWRLNSNRIEFYCWLMCGWMAPGEIETAAAAAAINMIIKCEKLDVAIECAIVLLFEVKSWPTQSRLHSSHSRHQPKSINTL